VVCLEKKISEKGEKLVVFYNPACYYRNYEKNKVYLYQRGPVMLTAAQGGEGAVI
jgi:hypothetical protein